MSLEPNRNGNLTTRNAFIGIVLALMGFGATLGAAALYKKFGPPVKVTSMADDTTKGVTVEYGTQETTPPRASKNTVTNELLAEVRQYNQLIQSGKELASRLLPPHHRRVFVEYKPWRFDDLRHVPVFPNLGFSLLDTSTMWSYYQHFGDESAPHTPTSQVFGVFNFFSSSYDQIIWDTKALGYRQATIEEAFAFFHENPEFLQKDSDIVVLGSHTNNNLRMKAVPIFNLTPSGLPRVETTFEYVQTRRNPRFLLVRIDSAQ